MNRAGIKLLLLLVRGWREHKVHRPTCVHVDSVHGRYDEERHQEHHAKLLLLLLRHLLCRSSALHLCRMMRTICRAFI
uniref:Uncharacterized protein n=1 Tax=Setaria italica TaxID=4555 RepID=K4AHI3_SETIT